MASRVRPSMPSLLSHGRSLFGSVIIVHAIPTAAAALDNCAALGSALLFSRPPRRLLCRDALRARLLLHKDGQLGRAAAVKSVNATFKREPGAMGSLAWQNADPAMIAQYAQIDGWVRAAFIRKVYAILTTQLLITVGMTVGLLYAAFVSGDPAYPSSWGHWIVGPGRYLMLLTMLGSFCILCPLMGCKNQFPLNFIGLGLFTCAISFAISSARLLPFAAPLALFLCSLSHTIAYPSLSPLQSCASATTRHGFGEQIMLAFIITLATFIALTAFTIVSKIDFSFLAPHPLHGHDPPLAMVLNHVVGLHVGRVQRLVADGLLHRRRRPLCRIYHIRHVHDCYGDEVDDYIIAAIELYLDVINLFLMILQLLVLCGSQRKLVSSAKVCQGVSELVFISILRELSPNRHGWRVRLAHTTHPHSLSASRHLSRLSHLHMPHTHSHAAGRAVRKTHNATKYTQSQRAAPLSNQSTRTLDYSVV